MSIHRVRRAGAASAVALLAVALSMGPARAQQVEVRAALGEETQELRLTDGSVYHGRVIDASDPATFELLSGIRMEIPHDRISSLTTARGTVRGEEYWRPDPNRTRLFFGPTARSLPAGGGYFSVFELFMPFVSTAVSDNLILSGGTPLIFLFDENETERPVWFAPKLTLGGNDRAEFAIGALLITTLGGDGSAGVVYGVTTVGEPDGALTLGLGYGFADGDWGGSPAALLGLERRMSRSTKLISENYVLPDGTILLSAGPRFIGDRLSADVGLLVPIVDGGIDGALPLVNFAWTW